MSKAVDGKYYQVVGQDSLPERLLIKARDRIYSDFVDHMRPEENDSIVDVGVSDIINDGANVLERKYPYQDKLTACGLSEATTFRRAFPRCTYRKILPHAPLPFHDAQFEIATANAVLEHVGSFDQQRFFTEELCRVSKRVFMTVPNRFFPIEHHTSIPLLHYNDVTFRLACRLIGRSEWSEADNLVLMTLGRLKRLTTGLSRTVTLGYTGFRFGPMSSNLFVSIN